MQRRFTLVAGFVLAGGASRRMGQPKAELTLDGQTMLERQVRLLGSVCGSVGVVGWPPPGPLVGPGSVPSSGIHQAPSRLPRFPEAIPILADDFPGRGPLGGIYTGLGCTHSELNLFLACDLPFMTAAFLRYLCHRALATAADVTVPESRRHGFHALCAVYRRRVRRAVRRSLEAGENKVSEFFARVRCEVLREREILRAGSSLRIFDNINTPGEYEAALRRFTVCS